MSNELRKVDINGFDYEIMGKPRYYVLSFDSENRRHLVECSELYYNTHHQKFLINGYAFNQNTTADQNEITAQLSNSHNRLYLFSGDMYMGYTDFSFKGYDPVLAIPVREIYGPNNYTCSFEKLDYFD